MFPSECSDREIRLIGKVQVSAVMLGSGGRLSGRRTDGEDFKDRLPCAEFIEAATCRRHLIRGSSRGGVILPSFSAS